MEFNGTLHFEIGAFYPEIFKVNGRNYQLSALFCSFYIHKIKNILFFEKLRTPTQIYDQ